MKDIELSLRNVFRESNPEAFKWGRNRGELDKMQSFAREILAAGYKITEAKNLRQKHITAVVKAMKERGASDARIMNVLPQARAWAALVGKPAMVPTNSELGLSRGRLERSAVKDQSRTLEEVSKKLLPRLNEEARAAAEVQLRLMAPVSQGGFGMRFEEASKFKPGHVVKDPKTGEKVRVIDHEKGTVNMVSHTQGQRLRCNWAKNGRPRQIPIRNEKQVETLRQAEALAKGNSFGSTNPRETFAAWQDYMGDRARAAGLGKADSTNGAKGPFHSLRHGYVHERYQEITGQPPPVLGGPGVLPEAAREGLMALSEEIGHGRLEVLKEYLGDFEIK